MRWARRFALGHYPCLVVLAVFVLPFPTQSAASGFWSKSNSEIPSITRVDVASSSAQPTDKSNVYTDLTTLILNPLNGQSELYLKAAELLGSIQSAPSCNRLAASSLLTSCKSIEGPSSDSENSTDDVKSIYAAQLAVCELRSAGALTPPQCALISPTASDKQAKGYYKVDKYQLSQCLQSLESRPQWWTSYSNNKQNAVVMCRAARVEIEKDDMIRVLKSLVSTGSDLDDMLSQTLQDAAQRMVQQRDLAKAIDSFQRQLLRDLELASDETQSYFMRLMESMDSVMQNLLRRVSSVVKVLETDVIGLSQIIRKSNDDAIGLNKSIGKVFQQVLQGSSEIAASQTREWEISQGAAVELRNTLDTMRIQNVDVLLSAFGDLHRQLQLTNELVTNVYFRQDALDQKLVVLDTSFDKLQTKAEAFHELQSIQSETQTRLHNQMQVAMQVTSERLALIDASASNVGSKLKDISLVLKNIAQFGGIFGSWVRWRWPWTVVIILFIFNRKMAVYAAAILTSVFFVIDSLPSVPPDMVLIHYASGYQLKVANLLKASGVIAFLCTILLIVTTAQTGSLSHIIRRWWSTPLAGIFRARLSHTIWSVR
ncbi:MAG: hypothetical protein Q9187_006010 [Circinaria calcarea]